MNGNAQQKKREGKKKKREGKKRSKGFFSSRAKWRITFVDKSGRTKTF